MSDLQPHTGFGFGSRGRLAAITAMCCWSAGNVIVASSDMPGLQIAFWRLLLGGVTYGLVFFGTGRRLHWATVRLVFLPAVVIGLEIGTFFTALRNTTVANATIIGALQPIVLLAVASRRFQESVTRLLFGASLIAVGGVAVAVLGSSDEVAWSPRGDLLAFLSMFLFSAYFVTVKNVRGRVDTFTLQTVSMAIGAMVVFPMAAVDAGTLAVPVPSWAEWRLVLLLLAIPGTGHVLMNWAHLHVSLSLTGMLTLAIPVVSAGGAWLAIDEPITAVQVLGMTVVVVVLAFVVRRDVALRAPMGRR